MANHSSLSSDLILGGTSGTWAVGLATGTADASSIGNVRNWAATIRIQLIDKTSKSDAGFENDEYGTKACEGIVTVRAVTTVALDGQTGSHTFTIGGSTDPTLNLILYDTTTDHKLSGSAKCSQIGVGANFEATANLIELTYAFKMQGAFTVVQPA